MPMQFYSLWLWALRVGRHRVHRTSRSCMRSSASRASRNRVYPRYHAYGFIHMRDICRYARQRILYQYDGSTTCRDPRVRGRSRLSSQSRQSHITCLMLHMSLGLGSSCMLNTRSGSRGGRGVNCDRGGIVIEGRLSCVVTDTGRAEDIRGIGYCFSRTRSA